MCGLKKILFTLLHFFFFLFTTLPYIGSILSFVKFYTFVLLAPLKKIGAYDGGLS